MIYPRLYLYAKVLKPATGCRPDIPAIRSLEAVFLDQQAVYTLVVRRPLSPREYLSIVRRHSSNVWHEWSGAPRFYPTLYVSSLSQFSHGYYAVPNSLQIHGTI